MNAGEHVGSDSDGMLVEVPCPVCGCTRSKHLFTAKDWQLKVTDEIFSVRRCAECGAGYVNPRPAASCLAKYYPPRYYWTHEGTGEPLSWEEIVACRRGQLAAKAAVLEDMTPGRLLDIGAQKGEFLWHMRERGWLIEGAELDISVPNPMGLPIRYGDFLQLDFPVGQFDAITMWAVLEHLYEPCPFVKKAATLLKPGGRFVALVTNLNSIQGRYFRADDFPRHLNLFTARSARELARRCGLLTERIWTDQAIFGGALNGGLVYLLKRLGGYTLEEAFSEWKQLEEPMRFWSQWRGEPSSLVLNLSRLDRAATWLPERLLDRLGYGFNMSFVLRKPYR